ncbi:hypothetical protein F5I97DRAFT_1804682 [Phlebopus sp. FC_14]|nr:hypothetical protein F5I97DRAFT_1804682 [Phlebopus sp. FC_14]
MNGLIGLNSLTRTTISPTCWKRLTHSYLRSSGQSYPSILFYTSSTRSARRSTPDTRFLSSTTSQTIDIPKARTLLLTSPTEKDLEEQELAVDLIPQEQIQLTITDRAAEQLRKVSTRESNPRAALRIAVESGGCHGYQYKMELATERSSEDYHLTHPEVRPSNLYIDAVSLSMINGSTIDYATELIGSSFRVAANPQAKGGCGCGISWEMKE